MVGHTPGEWWLNPDGDESCSDPSIAGPDGPIATIHHTTRVVGEGADARVEWGHVEDGHLIAAAPDLLAACERMDALFPQDGSRGLAGLAKVDADFHRAIVEMRAAIAKARNTE